MGNADRRNRSLPPEPLQAVLPTMETALPPPITLVPAGKIRCYIHDNVFRNDTQQEHVRQRIARSLVEEYGYDRQDIHIDFPIKIGNRSRRADIVIFPPGYSHKQENILIIVETKTEDVRPNDRNELPLVSWSRETFEVYYFRKRVNTHEESAKDLHRGV